MEQLAQNDFEVGKGGGVIVDIESLVQSTDRGSGRPKMKGTLSRKSSNRTERRNSEDVEVDVGSKKVAAKEAGEGRCKRFNRIMGIHPRKILLLFATMSSLGTMILIYFTLAINNRDGI